MNYLNKIILFISLISFNLFFAQVAIGTASPASSSLLHLESNSKGLLIPRMLSAQRTAISSPSNGLLIYQTDGAFPGFYYYDDTITEWQLLPNNLESVKGINTNLILNGTNLELTDGKGTITVDLSSLKELPIPTASGAMNYWNGSAWVEVTPTLNEGATLKMLGGVPTWDGGTPPPPSIGDVINGGLVFWIDPTDPLKFKICSPDDLTLSQWAAASTVCEDYTYTDADTGVDYTDWYLPDVNELSLIFSNLINNNFLTVNVNNHYWSSDSQDSVNAKRVLLANGQVSVYQKTQMLSVRPVHFFDLN